ncbi:uncharacterized protein LOC128158089 [Crassostrea angulata]|uniref:uncharacterized protein LOC128158089 n=1 Tax=Magallana angulata TaxID=2784310 RepID=UPI0022B11D06|nr:uncharacterized protein LOC128158089 [Crassostrea angulata]
MVKWNCVFWTCMTVLSLWIILAYFHESYQIDFWTKIPTCGDKKSGHPFYFGTTDVECMRSIRRRKKRALVSYPLPERKYWSLVHRWVYYDGWYFELFYRPHTRRPAKSKFCRSSREVVPAGYSTLDIDCLRRCAVYYNKRFIARYKTFTHNCHHYANKIAEVLCTYSMCPDWCQELFLEPGDSRLVTKFVLRTTPSPNFTRDSALIDLY